MKATTMCHLQAGTAGCHVRSPDGSGMSREVHIPFYERLGVQFPRPTHRFGVSVRDVEDLLAQRGVTVTYETIRPWCQRFGPVYARRLTRRQGRLGDICPLDEVFVTIQGRRLSLWRVVDSRWRRHRYPRPVASRLPGCHTLFSQAVEGPRASARTIGHRHAAQRQGCAPSGPAVRRPAHGPIRAPSCRSLPSAHTAPRATPAPGQSSRAGTTILVRAWTRPHPLPRWPSPGASGASSGATKTLFSHWGCRHDRRLTRTAITTPSTGALDDRSLDCEHHSAACRGRSVTLVGAGGWWPDPQLD